MPLSVFETTIRYLGGLLSAYELSDYKYPALLEKAEEVAKTMTLAWVGVGPAAACIQPWTDEGELQKNAIPYGHMTPNNVPKVGVVRPVVYGRALR